MTHRYTEDQLIEQTCMGLLETLGWQTANLMQGESFGPLGFPGRDSEHDALLRYPLQEALQRLNPGLPYVVYEVAWETLKASSSVHTLTDINSQKYSLLRDGIPVDYRDEEGRMQRVRARVFDFGEVSNNDFLAVRQMWYMGASRRRRRTDILLYVNGIPLVFIELKAHHRKLEAAHQGNLRDYLDVIPQLFHCNAFAILSNGLESRIGAATAPFGYFHEWKRIAEEEAGRVSLETIVRGVCDRARLLDLFEHFILFDHSREHTVKLIARNHQYIGVNKAIRHYLQQQERFAQGEIDADERRKLGVFWHTQGSGKSYSMVFLTRKMLRSIQGGFTFVVVTDREELDKQIYQTFQGVGAPVHDGQRAADGAHLRRLLGSGESFVFTLIHKFNFSDTATLRDDVIVISDEAHRTQSGVLAMNMRKALPGASLMGFTGTPLFKDDELTQRLFGKYVSVYDFKRSIEDGATVPLFYENRGELLHLDKVEISEQIREAIEEAELDPDQEEKVKRLFSREYPILTAEKRLRAIARDVVWHFSHRGYQGKAMYVALDKLTAVKMYDFIKDAWQDYIRGLEEKLKRSTDDQADLITSRALDWARETEMAVVVSSEQNEIAKFQAWGLDIEPHRLKMNTRDLEKEFKDENHPLRLVIVCAMWITGFDVKSLSTLYLDKPLKSHTLMQTIARANRVHTGKSNGLIVDYIETYRSLLEALAIYAIGQPGGGDEKPEAPVKPPEEQAAYLREALDALREFLLRDLHYDLDSLIHSEGLDALAAIQLGVDAIYFTDETRQRFMVMAREVFKRYKGLVPNPLIYTMQAEHDAINALYSRIRDNTEEADISAVMARVQGYVDQAIEASQAAEPEEGVRIDISDLDFGRIEQEFRKVHNQRPTIQSLRTIIELKLAQMLRDNPLRIDYYERYQEIIADYNMGKDMVEITEIFRRLRQMMEDLGEEEHRAAREGLDEEELAVYDLLRRGKHLSDQKQHELKDLARALLAKLSAHKRDIERWDDKDYTKAQVRTLIYDQLFTSLPFPDYEGPDIEERTGLVFDYVLGRYGMVG